MMLKTIFWVAVGIILYAYLGYTLLLAIAAFFAAANPERE